MICVANCTRGAPPLPQASHPQPDKPCDHFMMDFIELSPYEGKKYCLVIVDITH